MQNIKLMLENELKIFFAAEGLELRVAANDNYPTNDKMVILDNICAEPLPGRHSLHEIHLLLRLLGKADHCARLTEKLWRFLHPLMLSVPDLTMILMSLHIEELPLPVLRQVRQKAVMRWVMEEN
jgi:hypothetical protein